VQGEPLTITEKGRAFDITDSKGRTARITIADVLQSNGVIHVIKQGSDALNGLMQGVKWKKPRAALVAPVELCLTVKVWI
jgi:hypothetical protein